MAAPRPLICGCLVLMAVEAASAQLPPLPRYVCARTTAEMTVDGELGEPAWQKAAKVELPHWCGHKEAPPQKTSARLLWDDKNLYVAFVCEDRDIFATKTKRDDRLWEDLEVAEVYVDVSGDGRNYKEFEVNPLNAVIDLNTPDAQSVAGVDVNLRWNAEGLKTAVSVEGTLDDRTDKDKRGTGEMAIPLGALSLTKPKAGDTWRVNLYRYDNAHHGKEKFHLSSWSAVEKWPHEPPRFGTLVFGTKGGA